MSNWYNESGHPLASNEWLEAHHQAKLQERKAFVKRIADRHPQRIVDLGCGPGLWLELFSEVLSEDCQLFGIDADEKALHAAFVRSQGWRQSADFQCVNLDKTLCRLPDADVYLAFNLFPYVADSMGLLENIRQRLRPGGCLIVRQYDGALLRVGPMSDQDRQIIDMSLKAAVLGSGQFKHYDLDRVFQSITSSNYTTKSVDFEIFRRVAPYPPEFQGYFRNTMDWTLKYISDDAKMRLNRWLELQAHTRPEAVSFYFMEVDLVAWLS